MPFTGLAARIVYALLAGIVTFVVLLILAAIVVSFSPEVADILRRFAALIAFLVGLYYFFAGYKLFHS